MNVPGHENHASIDQTHQLCDFCNESKALLYCRADSAKLCLKCDHEVHSTNQLFKKHVRFLLCNSCNFSPSSIFCCTESAVLCQNCDWETHKNFGSIHDRRPLEGFNGCPSGSELLNILGLEYLGKKSLSPGSGGQDDDDDDDNDHLLDFLVWETPSISNLDDLIVDNDFVDTGRSFQAMGIPPLPKNRHAACGKRKEEILCQLREMVKEDLDFSGSLDDIEHGLRSQLPDKCPWMDGSLGLENNAEQISDPSQETTTPPKWSCFTSGVSDKSFTSTFISSFVDMNHLVLDKDSDFDKNTSIPIEVQSHGPLSGARDFNTQERETAISRYKEKKKTRRYDKHIRYESRKARAETRTRIKGRFAKMDR